jgi:hypothetical protein
VGVMLDLIIVAIIVISVIGNWLGYFRVENVISITALAVAYVIFRLSSLIEHFANKLEEIDWLLYRILTLTEHLLEEHEEKAVRSE